MRAESPMLSTERRMVEQLLLSSRRDQATEATTHDPAGDGGDEQDYIPSRDELWQFAHENFPVMHDLHDELVENIDPSGRRSLLKGFVAYMDLGFIVQKLTRRIQNYTAKLTSVFLHKFNSSELTTQTQYGANDPKYVRLATLDIGRKRVQGYDAASHDVKDFFESKKSLELILLVNKLVGKPIFCGPFAGNEAVVDGANQEGVTHDLLKHPIILFNSLFDFFERFKVPFKVEAVSGRVGGRGVPDLSVKVSANNVAGGQSKYVTEYLAMVEYKKPNAGFWIAWKLLSGKPLTEAEKAAFFELETLPSDRATEYLLNKWQNTESAQWEAVKEVLDQVGRNKVDVKYGLQPKKNTSDGTSDGTYNDTSEEQDVGVGENDLGKDTNNPIDPNRTDLDLDLPSDPIPMDVEQGENPEGQAGPNTMDIEQNIASPVEELVPSYFVDGNDITELLRKARLQFCCNSFYNGLNQVTVRYAVPNNCSLVVVADGLTIIGGSVHKLEKTQGSSNPLGSDDVLDVHFFKTYMMQTHDKDSSLYWLNFLCNSGMSSSRLREFVFKLLKKAKKSAPVFNVTKADQELVREFMRQSSFEFDSERHCLKSEALEKSNELLVKRMRASVNQAVVEFGDMFPELEAKPLVVPSEAFAIRELFRGVYDYFDGSESPPHGRSNSVAKVQLVGDPKGKHYVLKEYLGDDESVARMRRELKAYSRVAKLPKIQKHVAELITFGALDLHSGTPRLFLLLEYVDGPDEVAIDDDVANAKVAKVDKLLRSVGVCHNDLEDRNYRWQRSSHGHWSIKVFDFDHATFNDGLAMKPRSAATTKAGGA